MIQRDRSVNWKTVVEITQFEQKKKEKKSIRTMEETSETTSRIVPFTLEKSQKKKRQRMSLKT